MPCPFFTLRTELFATIISSNPRIVTAVGVVLAGSLSVMIFPVKCNSLELQSPAPEPVQQDIGFPAATHNAFSSAPPSISTALRSPATRPPRIILSDIVNSHKGFEVQGPAFN